MKRTRVLCVCAFLAETIVAELTNGTQRIIETDENTWSSGIEKNWEGFYLPLIVFIEIVVGITVGVIVIVIVYLYLRQRKRHTGVKR